MKFDRTFVGLLYYTCNMNAIFLLVDIVTYVAPLSIADIYDVPIWSSASWARITRDPQHRNLKQARSLIPPFLPTQPLPTDNNLEADPIVAADELSATTAAAAARMNRLRDLLRIRTNTTSISSLLNVPGSTTTSSALIPPIKSSSQRNTGKIKVYGVGHFRNRYTSSGAAKPNHAAFTSGLSQGVDSAIRQNTGHNTQFIAIPASSTSSDSTRTPVVDVAGNATAAQQKNVHAHSVVLNLYQCQLRLFRSPPIIRIDAAGKKCWSRDGHVETYACDGMCSSYDLPHWEFPFKRTVHRTCQASAYRQVEMQLDCEDGADVQAMGTHRYAEPVECECKVCSSSFNNDNQDSTSCVESYYTSMFGFQKK